MGFGGTAANLERCDPFAETVGLRNADAHGYDVISSQEIRLTMTTEQPGTAAALRQLPGMEDAR